MTGTAWARVLVGGAVLLSAFDGVAAFGDTGAAPAAPALRISIDNGRTATRTGDQLRYTVEVRNTGTVAVKRLTITQSVPVGLRVVSADRAGVVGSGQVRWTVALPSGRTERFRSTATVGATPSGLLRLASVACATLPAVRTPIVCAAHSDQLPAGAGVSAVSAVPDPASPGPASPGRAILLPTMVGSLLLLGVLTGWVVRRRKRRPAEPTAA